jgi:hypothetical protein
MKGAGNQVEIDVPKHFWSETIAQPDIFKAYHLGGRAPDVLAAGSLCWTVTFVSMALKELPLQWG